MSWRAQTGSPRKEPSKRTSSKSGSSPPRPANRWAAAMDDNPHQSRTHHVNESEQDLNDFDYLRRKTKETQQNSLDSTRRALARLQETESIGQNNLVKIASQTDQLNRVEHRLNSAQAKMDATDAKTSYLKSLTKPFFLPAFGSKKVREKETRLQKEIELAEQYEQEIDSRHQSRMQHLSKAQERAKRSNSSYERAYTTPDGLERDDVENEIDSNLDQISAGLSRLKMMGVSMNEELTNQDDQMKRLYDKTAYTDERMQQSTSRLNRILKK